MADRPWVTPQEVKDYTEYPSVQKRVDAKLQTDISRAEQYVIAYTDNNFAEAEKIPDEVRTAVILIAEAYAYNADVATKNIKSETFDDYSYTAETQSIDVETLDVKPLLDGHVIEKAKNNVIMRLRKL